MEPEGHDRLYRSQDSRQVENPPSGLYTMEGVKARLVLVKVLLAEMDTYKPHVLTEAVGPRDWAVW